MAEDKELKLLQQLGTSLSTIRDDEVSSYRTAVPIWTDDGIADFSGSFRDIEYGERWIIQDIEYLRYLVKEVYEL